jgi:purine-binding chemotaxis protein CheW
MMTNENVAAGVTEAQEQGFEQYLTFIVDGEEYGVDILRVQGIQGWASVTPIPNTPKHILGVINLRGAVVPVIDLRCRFGLPSVEFGPTTVVIIVRVEDSDKERTVGMVVDAVSEVYNVMGKDIQAMPEFGRSIDTRAVRSIATLDDKMVILLEIDKLLGIEDSGTLEAMACDVAQDEETARNEMQDEAVAV